ncbi:putative wall-associated receptor kinase, galacturonan-binding domain-containing protein [Helianthus debilis subsp. tardiflorus]
MKLFQLAYLLLLFSLLLTATPPALAIYAKTGCSDRCGNVIIPYPFGIGAGCAINSWYMVDCKNLTPYLSVLNNHLELLRVDLRDQTVTVSMPRISYCQKPFVNSSHTVSIDLGRSPFLFSKSHNKFV